jgi:transposase
LKSSKIPAEISNFKNNKILHIADAALVTQDNLFLIEKQGLRFISRFTGTFNLASELIEKAFALEDWEKYSSSGQKTSYRLKEFEADLFGHRYRFVVVCPLSPDKRKLKGLESRLQKEKEKLVKESEDLSKIAFACETDAREALFGFLKEKQNSLYQISGDIELCFEKQKKSKKRGRPARDEIVEYRQFYRIEISIEGPDIEALEQKKQRMGSFALITNIFDGYDAQSILREYKEQTVVENALGSLRILFT